MKLLSNIVFYGTCFFLLSKTIYHLIFIVPPLPGAPGYEKFRLLSLALSLFLGGLIVVLFILLENKDR